MRTASRRPAFTLIELLVVIGIISLLIALIAPGLSAAKQNGIAAKCLANLHVLGQGLTMYATEYRDVLVPGRLPKLDNTNWYADIAGGRKFRPTFLAMMGGNVGVSPFDDPMPAGNQFDRFGEKGDQQNYSNPIFICPKVPDWGDERNGSYGYNYQFLGNSRLRDASDPNSFKNWPVTLTKIRNPGAVIAVGDCMGTAASEPTAHRGEYDDDSRDAYRYGNEGFNLDPPRIAPADGECAGYDDSPPHRTSIDPRHLGRGAVLYVDAHADARSMESLGYNVAPDGVVLMDGDNSQWSGTGQDVAWTTTFRPQ